MALKKCRACGGDVSPNAAVCPRCGEPVKKKTSVLKMGCLTVVILFVGLILLGSIIAKNAPTQPAKSPNQIQAEQSQQQKADDAAIAAAAKARADRDAAATKATKDAADAEAAQLAKVKSESPVYPASKVVGFYAANEVAGDEALKGRYFKVSGEVDRVGKDMFGNAYVAFKSEPGTIRAVQCIFPDPSELSTLRPGQSVTVFGKCDGLMMNIVMRECELVH